MLTATERQRMYETAIHQAQAERAALRLRVERLRAEHATCRSCHDPDSDPVFDGGSAIVCDICGEEWR